MQYAYYISTLKNDLKTTNKKIEILQYLTTNTLTLNTIKLR
jgi:hypothetical protein